MCLEAVSKQQLSYHCQEGQEEAITESIQHSVVYMAVHTTLCLDNGYFVVFVCLIWQCISRKLIMHLSLGEIDRVFSQEYCFILG